MKQMNFLSLRFFPLVLSFICSGAFAQNKADESGGIWPFDQRQIVLVKKEGVSFPDQKTVAQIMDVFSRRGRVRWVTLKGGEKGKINPIEVPVDFEWQSFNSIRKLGLRFKADGLVVLSTRGIQLDLQWFSTKDGQPLFFEKVSLPNASSADQEIEKKKRIQDWLLDIWSKIPGEGYIVSRDLTHLKFEGADQLGVKVGDKLELLRLGQIERHPLLKTLVGMGASITGRAEVTEIAKPFSNAKISYESQVDPIQAGDRFIRVTEKKESGAKSTSSASASAPTLQKSDPPTGDEKPLVDEKGRQYLPLMGPEGEEEKKNENSNQVNELKGAEADWNFFDIDGGLHFKRVTHAENTAAADATGASSFSMKAWAPGFDLSARVLLTREILLGGQLGYSLLTFRGLDDIYGVASIGSGTYNFSFMGGYRFFFLNEPENFFKGEVLLQAAFKKLHLSMGTLAASSVGPSAKDYSGFELGFRLQVPVLPLVGLQMGGGLMLAPSLTESEETGGASSTSQVYRFDARGVYQLDKTSDFFAGLEIESAQTNFTGAGTRTIGSSSVVFSTTSYQVGYSQRF
jgi:hypothetical protein